jgi:hypothetical protein
VDIGVVVAQSHHEHIDPATDEDDELFFFDACENPLAEDEYPYISITDYLRPKRRVSMKDPLSMLRKHQSVESSEEHPKLKNETDDGLDGDDSLIQRRAFKKHVSEPINSHKSRSERFLTLTSRSTVEHQAILQQPRVKIPQRGFPGDLTMAELGECVRQIRMCRCVLLGSITLCPCDMI